MYKVTMQGCYKGKFVSLFPLDFQREELDPSNFTRYTLNVNVQENLENIKGLLCYYPFVRFVNKYR